MECLNTTFLLCRVRTDVGLVSKLVNNRKAFIQIAVIRHKPNKYEKRVPGRYQVPFSVIFCLNEK